MTAPSPTPYDDWARAFHGAAYLRRSAERNAAFLLPHLRPGQRLVDVGCGPGSITEGLAARLAPGREVVGVDRDVTFVEQARARSDGSVRYEVGDVFALPFDDASFDVAFLHALLQHVAEPGRALTEVRRVLRPGGIVAIGDLDMDGYLLHPRNPTIDAAMAVDRAVRRSPDIGRRLPELLAHAGFTEVRVDVVANTVTGDGAAVAAGFTAARFEAPPFVAHALAEGWATTADELAAMATAWREWATAPGALLTTLWCQVLATAA